MMKKGFTLLEVIVAIFIITVGIIGVLSLVTYTISSAKVSSQKLVAAYLAQEGIEIVRNIRDGNWLFKTTWDTALGKGDWEGDYQDILSLTNKCSSTPFNCEYDDLQFLKIDGGFYKYSASGTKTPFKRRITIFDKTDLSSPPDRIIDMLKVSVTVFWEEKGKTYEVEAQENLYNWKE